MPVLRRKITVADLLNLGTNDSYEVWRVGHPDVNYNERQLVSCSTLAEMEKWLAEHPPQFPLEYEIVRERIDRHLIATEANLPERGAR